MRDGLASPGDVSRALDAAAASIESTNAGRYDEARNILQQIKAIVIAERAAVDALNGEAQGAFDGCVAAVKELDNKIGEIDTTAERVSKDIKTTDDALRTAVSDGDVAASEIADIERALSGLEDGLRARQGKLEEMSKWWWVPGYGSYLGIRSLAEHDVQEITNLSREFQEKATLRNGSVERLRTAQAAWANLAAERSRLIAEKSSAAAMRDNLNQRMRAARDATAFLIDAKEFWADLASFIEFQVEGAATRANVFATALASKMGQPAPDALVLGIGGQQTNMRDRLVQLAGQLQSGKGYAALAAATCTSKPGAAPLKACDITPSVPFYQITNFETCSFRYVNPPGCPPAEVSHVSVVLTPQQEWDVHSRIAKDQNWVARARWTSPEAIYLGRVDTEYECVAACLGAAGCRFWTFNSGNRMMPGSVSECWGGTENLAPETGAWSGFLSGDAR